MHQLSEDVHNRIDQTHMNLVARIRQFLFLRNYNLVSSLKLTITQAVILIIIEQFQKISIITRLSVNPILGDSPEMQYVSQICRLFLFDLFQVNDSHNFIITVLLLLGQISIMLVILLPIKGEIINEVLSKYIFTFLQMIITLPSIILSVNFVVHGINIGPNIILYLLSITTNMIYESMQIQCSFQRENENVFVRTARPITQKILYLTLISIFPIITYYMFPVSFVMYGMCMLLIEIYCWIYYLYKFIYFHETLMYVKGIMLTINISAYFCYLIIDILSNAIISQNVLLFITTFSIFLGNFFITYRKYILKNTIINKDLKGENQIGLYCIFYWHCFTKITEKKNQLYVSSLLKKHTNQCVDPSCCCKNRQHLYDTYLKAFGNPKIQPHFDKIFIRHFIRKLLCDGYDKFNKSSILAFLLSNYNIEVVEMITQTMELIRKLSKMQQKKQLYFTEQFLLFCLKVKTRSKIISINFKRGNVDLQSVKQFDQQLIRLNDSLKVSVKMYHDLWKQLQNLKINQSQLYDICKANLELMFSIQNNYKHLKSINTQSSELRAIMLFYARLVLHDIHLLSEVKKDIKNGHERNLILSTLQLSSIKLFGSNTATFISLQNARIKWTSKNAHSMFEYNIQEFHNVTVKNLMPKYFADRHDYYIQRWKTTGHHIKLNKTTYLWGNTKSGACFSMLMFVKVIPLLQDQQYGFFSSIEKLDDQSELICNSYGKVYGAGKLFSKIININSRFIQEVQMNIQVFIPFTFDYFLEFFYPNNAKLKNIKKNYEMRRLGYFPQNLEYVLKELQQQRQKFIQKYQKGEKGQAFSKQYLNFVRHQMQEITCNINGQYISLSIFPFKTTSFANQKESIVILKISNAKKDSIEKYYGELEKMIAKLQSLNTEEKSKSNKSLFKRNKSDFFKVFLNPKRMKRLLQKQQQQTAKGKSGNSNQGQQKQFKRQLSRQLSLKSKSTKNIVEHRKQLALGAKIEIKNDRVRYNIFKMKKILLQEGVISRYTYNILLGKHAIPALVSEANINDRQNPLDQSKTLKELQQQRIISQDEKDSINHDSDGQLAADKQNDNQTFNSASSSATFISMTNHVKLFKLKLRSLNTPKPLMLLNLVILTLLISGIIGLIYLTIANMNNLEIGLKQFQNNRQANIIIDSLFLGQLNIQSINNSPNNIHYGSQKSYYLASVSKYYERQMLNRAQYKKIDPKILSYLTLIITDVQTLTIRQYIQMMLDQIIKDSFEHVMRYFIQSMNVIANHSATNVFFQRISTDIFVVFIVYLILAIALFILTLPIVWKLQIKIKEIYDLLSKISTNDRLKYFKHYANLNDQFKNRDEIDCNELNNLIATYQSKFKYLKSNTRAGFSQQSLRMQNQKKQVVVSQQDQPTSLSTDKFIYFKITSVYLILITSIIFNYVFLASYHTSFMNVNDAFVQLFNYKTLLTSRIVEGQYEMMGYNHEASYNSSQIQFVQTLYHTYSIYGVSEDYKQVVRKIVTGMPCNIISNILKDSQLAFCNLLNNHTFSQGGIDNLYYTQRKIEEKVTDYYNARNNTPNDESTITYPNYFFSRQYHELNVGYFYSTLMIYNLFYHVNLQINKFANNYVNQFYIAIIICLILILLFIILWVFVYLKLAESASYINAFLLLIPFEVLSENPYIKLYIKNQFDYKANY